MCSEEIRPSKNNVPIKITKLNQTSRALCVSVHTFSKIDQKHARITIQLTIKSKSAFPSSDCNVSLSLSMTYSHKGSAIDIKLSFGFAYPYSLIVFIF